MSETPNTPAPSTPAPAAPVSTPSTPAPSSPAVETPRMPTITARKSVDPVKILGLAESPSLTLNRMGKEYREKNAEKPLFAPKAPAVPVVPATPETPAAKAPEVPAVPATPETPVVTPTPEKKTYTIDGKEYTEEELKAKLAEKPAEIPKAAATPATPETPESKAAAEAEIKQQENTWMEARAKDLGEVFANDEEFDKVLAGGKEARTTFNNIIAKAIAKAQLENQKLTAATINPIIQGINEAVNPVVAHYQQQEVRAMENRFIEKYPLAKAPGAIDEARKIANGLYHHPQHGAHFQSLSEPEFFEAVYKGLNQRYEKLGITLDMIQPKVPAATNGATPPVVPTTPPVPNPALQPTIPLVKAPAANVPKGTPAAGKDQTSYSDSRAKAFASGRG